MSVSLHAFVKCDLLPSLNTICQTQEETNLLNPNKSQWSYQVPLYKFTHNRKTLCPGSHLQCHTPPQKIPLDSVGNQGPLPIHNSLFPVEEGHIERVCVCTSVSSAVQSFSSEGFVGFPGVAGFAELLGASLPKVLSLNCERICCEGKAFQTDCNSWSQASWTNARQDKSRATREYYTVTSGEGMLQWYIPGRAVLSALISNSPLESV